MAGKSLGLILSSSLTAAGASPPTRPRRPEAGADLPRRASGAWAAISRTPRRCRTAEQWQREEEANANLPVTLQVTQGQNDGRVSQPPSNGRRRQRRRANRPRSAGRGASSFRRIFIRNGYSLVRNCANRRFFVHASGSGIDRKAIFQEGFGGAAGADAGAPRRASCSGSSGCCASSRRPGRRGTRPPAGARRSPPPTSRRSSPRAGCASFASGRRSATSPGRCCSRRSPRVSRGAASPLTSLGAAEGIPRSTAHRWTRWLIDRGLLSSHADPGDDRITLVGLSDDAAERVRTYLANALSLSRWAA